ncbi:S41 family peptidase [Acidipila rosea]|uniref:Carboxyl-terminal processing protease n=1 Tax=Acidipila rosea TaxID=768535 RepID=A0A4R1LAH8_9BACT|nr:S41 family peptidase [Acidipila rosea]MBW4026889.1 PDZ domain-containing protein [Acidobacteriota bacterium]MBW4044957.1 PDZ domain-containing protein [Acidobacteriota bacterium]TCK75174.1 carboxyl-terminal processing protease [Acidipila rosea]
MSKGFKRSILAISVALVSIVFLGGFLPGGVTAGTQSDGAYKQMGVYEEVLHKIQSDYVTTPNIDTVTTGALHGLLESLDADSSYLTPAEYGEYKAHQNDGTAQTGMEISKRMGYATVVAVIKDSPADRAKIEAGDLVEAIQGQSTHQISLATIRELLKGQPGSQLTIELVRPRKPEPDKVTLTRVALTPPPIQEQQYDNASVLYLKPSEMTKEQVAGIEAKLRAMPKTGNKKILLDLRNVAEGNEEEGIQLANAFLKSGTIASLEGQKFPKKVFTADPSKFITDAPMAILVNHGTSGAAEIVAAAVLDNKRGDVVGERTFGEGAVQKTIDLPDGAAVILSIAKYESPSGKTFQQDAVTPNIQVSPSIDQYLAEEDGIVSKGPKADDQLNKALDVLKQKAA